MEIQRSDTASPRAVGSTASDYSATAAEKAESAIAATKRATDSAAQSVHAGLDSLQEKIPGMMTHAGTAADELIARGLERAKAASGVVREKTVLAQDQAVTYIRAEPVKAVLIAAGIGAVLALLLSSRSGR